MGSRVPAFERRCRKRYGPEGAPSRMGAGLREAEPDRSPLQAGVLGAVAEVARNEGAEMAVLLQNLIRRDFHFQQ